jgi:hypothetical protein
MKRILVAAFALLLFSSCEKKQCWQCTTVGYTSLPHSAATTTRDTVCDMTEKDKEMYELVNSTSWNSSPGTQEIESSKTTSCQ